MAVLHPAEPRATPRLTLYSLPTTQKLENTIPEGLVTPPLHPPVSVPFLWEEEPGRPRLTWISKDMTSTAKRCLVLDPPPRLLNNPQTKNSSSINHNSKPKPSISSLDDDENSRNSVFSLPYFVGHYPPKLGIEEYPHNEYGHSECMAIMVHDDYGKNGHGGERIGWLVRLRMNWMNIKKKKKAVAAADEETGLELVMGSIKGYCDGDDNGHPSCSNDAKITRVTKKRSITGSPFMTSICRSLKQVVRPRRKNATNSRMPPTSLLLPPNGSIN